MSTATRPRLAPPTPLPSATKRGAFQTVYIHGWEPAYLTEDWDTRGAYVVPVREADAGPQGESKNSTHFFFEWDRLTDEPAPPLRFVIVKESISPLRPYWIVYGTMPDWSGDYYFTSFDTHHEAMEWATSTLAALADRDSLDGSIMDWRDAL